VIKIKGVYTLVVLLFLKLLATNDFSISELVKENENGLLFSNGTQLAAHFLVNKPHFKNLRFGDYF